MIVCRMCHINQEMLLTEKGFRDAKYCAMIEELYYIESPALVLIILPDRKWSGSQVGSKNFPNFYPESCPCRVCEYCRMWCINNMLESGDGEMETPCHSILQRATSQSLKAAVQNHIKLELPKLILESDVSSVLCLFVCLLPFKCWYFV